MNYYLPHTLPSQILEYLEAHPTFPHFNIEYIDVNPLNQNCDLKTITHKETTRLPSIIDYYTTIEKHIKEDDKHKYYLELLKVFQLMTNEGLITPLNNDFGYKREYELNTYCPMKALYGQYDYLIYGFQHVRKRLKKAVKPVILDQNSLTRAEDIGTGFFINKFNGIGNSHLFVTARHCLKKGSKIQVPTNEAIQEYLIPKKIFVPKNKKIDVCIIEFDLTNFKPNDGLSFWVSEPEVLDNVLTLGYPKIQGFTEAIQVSESSVISSKGSEGQITGEGIHYHSGMQEHFLISARVKGGNSGSPVINKKGEVVGILTELLEDDHGLDLLGYGVALSSKVILKILDSINNNTNDFLEELNFKNLDDGFEII